MISLRQLITENLEIASAEELTPEQYEQLNRMVVESGIRILSDKELDTVYLIDGNVAAGLWTSFQGGVFSFDTIVDKKYRNQMLGARLIRQGLQMYQEIASDDPDAKLELDVVNDKLVEPLKKMGLVVLNQIAGHVIMGHPQ